VSRSFWSRFLSFLSLHLSSPPSLQAVPYRVVSAGFFGVAWGGCGIVGKTSHGMTFLCSGVVVYQAKTQSTITLLCYLPFCEHAVSSHGHTHTPRQDDSPAFHRFEWADHCNRIGFSFLSHL